MKSAALIASIFLIISMVQVVHAPENGKWLLKPTELVWKGDIHPGGEGSVHVRLLNLENFTVEVWRFEVWVEGFDKPIGALDVSPPALMETGDGHDFDIELRPPPTTPTGTIKAVGVLTIITIQDDERSTPFPVPVELEHVSIGRYRSFRLHVTDYWGLNPVPNVTVVLDKAGTPDQTRIVLTSENGTVDAKRVEDVAYNVRVLHDTPYTGERIEVMRITGAIFLSELVGMQYLRSNLYEAWVNVKDLSRRLLNATVHLGPVVVQAENGLAVFRNVPFGEYRLRIFWKGVEVFNDSIQVLVPLIVNAPGVNADVTADVGDITLRVRDIEGRKLPEKVQLKVEGQGISNEAEASTEVTFEQLPRGEYTVKAYAHNRLLGRSVEVGVYSLRIPDNHGVNELRLNILDASVVFTDADGAAVDVGKVWVEGNQFKTSEGTLRLLDVPAGSYSITVKWGSVTVYDDYVTLSGEARQVEVMLRLYNPVIRFSTLEGEPLSEGRVELRGHGVETGVDVVGGQAKLTHIPEETYNLTLTFRGRLVLQTTVKVDSSSVYVTAPMTTFKVTVVDQDGKPIPNLEVVVDGVGREFTSEAGEALFGQAPTGEYRVDIFYNGIKSLSAQVEAGTVKLTLPLHSVEVVVYNQLGAPSEASVELVRAGRLVGVKEAQSMVFQGLSEGEYKLRARRLTKEVEQRVEVPAEGSVKITLPIAFEVGTVALSLEELYTIFVPLVVVVTAIAFVVIARKTGKALTKGRRPQASKRAHV